MFKRIAFSIALAAAALTTAQAHAGGYTIVANPVFRYGIGNIFALQPPAEPPLIAMFTLQNGNYDPTTNAWTTGYQEGYLNLASLASGNTIGLDRWAVQPTQAAGYILNFRTSPTASNNIVSGVLHTPDGKSKSLYLSCGLLAANQYICDGGFAFPTARCSYSMHAVPGNYVIDFTHQNGSVTQFTIAVPHAEVPPSVTCND